MLKPIIVVLLAASILPAQQAPAWKEFSIGPATKASSRFGKEGLRSEGILMKAAIWRAYGVPEVRIIGGPDWLDTQRYAITALVNDPEDFQPLFQKELAARFNLKAHREMRDMSVYVLKKLDDQPHKLAAGTNDGSARITAGSVQCNNARLAWFANNLVDAVHRPVIDETGIPGTFDINLKWQPGDESSLIAAVKDTLGLQLISEKRSMPVLVIESIEKLKQ